MKPPGKNALYAEKDAGNYVQVLPEAYAETDLKALWKNIAKKSKGRVKKRRFFMRPLLWRPYSRQYSPEDTFWGLRMHFVVAESS